MKTTTMTTNEIQPQNVTSSNPAAPATAPAPADPPDPNAAFEAAVAQALPELDAIDASLGADPPVTPQGKRRSVRMRKGGEPIAMLLGQLAVQFQIETPSLQVATMKAALGKADAAQPLATRLEGLSKHVGNVVFATQSAAWTIALEFYAALKRRANKDDKVAKALAPVKEFMSYRHPEKKPRGTPSKTTERAVKKSVAKVRKLAPELLAETAAAPKPGEPQAPAGTNGAGGNGSGTQR